MRSVVAAALVLVLAGSAACGGDAESGPTACEVGPAFYNAAIAKLSASSPACSSDADCVMINTDLGCSSFAIASCGTVVHKAVANNWNQQAVCEQIEHASRPGENSCEIDASCASARVACVANRCSGVVD